MNDKLELLFSKPVSCHASFSEIPTDITCIWNEADASIKFNKNAYYKTYSKIKADIKDKNSVVLVAGRYAELYFFERGIRSFVDRKYFKSNYSNSILLDIEWHWRERNQIKFKNIINKLYHNIIGRGSSLITVFCEVERKIYSEAYGIPVDKFMWLPFCSDVDELLGNYSDDYNYPYFFSGGLHDRDYMTLFDAVRDTPVKFRIVAPKDHFDNIPVPDNVTIIGMLTRDQYFKEIGKSIGAVISVDSTSNVSSLRCPGVITYVTAMRMRKSVIVNEPSGACSYIVNGENGIIVEPNDALALREAMLKLWNDNNYRQEIANNAYDYSHKHFGYDRYFEDIRKMCHIVSCQC